MAQAQYNLTDNTQDAFTFKIGALEYSFRYPTTVEMRELSQLNNELQELAEKKGDERDEKLIQKKSDESEAKMNLLITSIGHDNTIAEVLETQPLPVVRNFRKMMAKEINLG